MNVIFSAYKALKKMLIKNPFFQARCFYVPVICLPPPYYFKLILIIHLRLVQLSQTNEIHIFLTCNSCIVLSNIQESTTHLCHI